MEGPERKIALLEMSLMERESNAGEGSSLRNGTR